MQLAIHDNSRDQYTVMDLENETEIAGFKRLDHAETFVRDLLAKADNHVYYMFLDNEHHTINTKGVVKYD